MPAVVFTESFTGSDDDAWNSTRWPTISSEGTVTNDVSIQSNQGHMEAGTAQNDFTSANAASITSLQDSKGLIKIIPGATGTGNEWLYVCLRSTGEQVAANAGRPATAYYFRFMVNGVSTQSILYRRLSNNEQQLDGDILAGHSDANRNAGETFWLRWEIEDDASVVGDTDIRWRIWDVDDTEPTGWESYTDGSPGALYGASGIFQLVGRNYSTGGTFAVEVDDIEITDPDATGAQDMTPGLAQQLVTSFAPTVTPGAVSFTPALEQQLVTSFDPQVQQTQFITPFMAQQLVFPVPIQSITAEAVSVDPELAQSLALSFDPTITSTVDISPGLAQQLASSSNPVLTTGAVVVSPGLVQQLAAAFDPNVLLAQNIDPTLVQQLVTAFNPDVTLFNQYIEPALVQQIVVSYDPVITQDASVVEPGFVQQLVVTFDPILTVGSVDINPNLVQQLVTPYDPELLKDAYLIEPAVAQSLATAFDPGIVRNILPELTQQLASAYDPVVSSLAAIVEPALAQQLVVTFDPTITAGTALIVPGLVQQLVIGLNPASIGDPSVERPVILGPLTIVNNVGLPIIDGTKVLYIVNNVGLPNIDAIHKDLKIQNNVGLPNF